MNWITNSLTGETERYTHEYGLSGKSAAQLVWAAAGGIAAAESRGEELTGLKYVKKDHPTHPVQILWQTVDGSDYSLRTLAKQP